MPNDYGKVKTAATIALAGIFAAITLYYMIKGEEKFKTYTKQQAIDEVKGIDTWLDRIHQEVLADRLNEAQVQLSGMKKLTLTREQQKRRFVLLGEIALKNYSQYLDDVHKRNYFTDLATKYFKRAIKLTDKKAEQNNISRRTAKIYMDEGRRQQSQPKWREAVKVLKQTRAYLLKPEERWEVMIDEADCLLNLNEINASLNLLDKIIDETENESIPEIKEMANTALRKKADVYYDIWTNPKQLELYNKSLKKAKQPTFSSKMAEIEAGKIYKYLIDNLPVLSSQIPYAQLGLMRIYTKRKNKEKSYTLINQMLETQLPPEIKAKALILLAELQKNLDEPTEAITSLEIAKNSYETKETAEMIASRLYDLYYQQKDYDNLLEIADIIFTRHRNLNLIQKIISDVFLGKSPVMNFINNSPTKKQYLTDIMQMFNLVESRSPKIWKKIQNDSQFISAQLSYYMGNYEDTEEKIEQCLNTPGNSRKLQESIAFLDIQCGLKQQKPDGISICRSLCYLQQFPKGVHYQDVLSILLNKYYDSGMYKSALNTAKKIYIDEISRFNSGQKRQFNKELWLTTVAKIGQCYDKLGSYDNSNRILRSYSFQLIDQPFAADVFLDWSEVAYKTGQLKEAIRRLNIVLPKLKDDADYLRVRVARFMLILKNKPTYPYSKYRTLITQLSKSTALSQEEKDKLKKTVYEAILNYSFKQKEISSTYNILKNITRDYPKEKWTEYWILRYITKIFEKGNLKTLKEKQLTALAKDLALKENKPNTYNFIKSQLELINSLEAIEKMTEKLKRERNF